MVVSLLVALEAVVGLGPGGDFPSQVRVVAKSVASAVKILRAGSRAIPIPAAIPVTKEKLPTWTNILNPKPGVPLVHRRVGVLARLRAVSNPGALLEFFLAPRSRAGFEPTGFTFFGQVVADIYVTTSPTSEFYHGCPKACAPNETLGAAGYMRMLLVIVANRPGTYIDRAPPP